MSRKSPEEHFQDYVDSGILSLIIPLFLAAPFQAARNVPTESLDTVAIILFGLISFMFLFIFIAGLMVSFLRGGVFGVFGYLLGNFGVNLLFTNTVLSILLMGFAAMAAYAGSTTRTRSDFRTDVMRTLSDLGL